MKIRGVGTLAVLALLAVAGEARAAVVVFNNNLAGYLAASGGDTLFLDFETDRFGNPVVTGDADGNSILDVDGGTFSNLLIYSTPTNGSFPARVNIGDIDQGIDNEIGPMGTWDGTLRWVYTGSYFATGFTGIEVESNSLISFYNGATLVDSTMVGGNNSTFQFFGFVSTDAFDRVELNGTFYAIDAHRSSAVPEPMSLALLGSGLAGLALRRRRQA